MYYLIFDNGDYLRDAQGFKRVFKTLNDLLAYAKKTGLREYTWKEIDRYDLNRYRS